jgi:sulfoxide reductase heme-binding subunit YedZ
MMRGFFEKIDPFIVFCFRLHDSASDFLAAHLLSIKRTMLIVAHLSLFGFLFPDLRKDFGEMAANVLLVILFLSPLSRIFRMRLLAQLMGIRRELGILMAYLATVHGLGYILDPAWFAVFIAPYWTTDPLAIETRLLFGMLAYLLTIPLFLTSNTLAVRFLGGKRWKMLHRLVYGIFFAAIFHRLFTKSATGNDAAALTQAIILVSAYLLAKLLAWKNFIAPLRDMITSVSERYQTYLLVKKAANSQNIPL